MTSLLLLGIGGVWTLAVFLAGALYRGSVGKALERETSELIGGIHPENS